MASHNNKCSNLRVYRIYMLWRFSKFLQVLRGEVILSKVEDFSSFSEDELGHWHILRTLNLSSKIFGATISRGALFLQYFAGDYCLLVWLVLLPCETIWHSKLFSQWDFQWSVGPEHFVLPVGKKILFYCTHSVSSLCTGWRL